MSADPTATTATTASAAPASVRGRDYVDWDFAARTARRLAPAGPATDRGEVAQLVQELRSAAARSVQPVATTSRLSAPDDAPPPLVVDRAGWIQVNTSSLEGMIGPVLDDVIERQRQQQLERSHGSRSRAVRRGGEAPEAVQRLGGVLTGTEVAGLLSWVSTKVLGQYDLAPGGTPRLLLVAPNILQAERELEVTPSDFRLWVCLHEETHRVQFTAVPWLREHIIGEARSLGNGMVPDGPAAAERLQALVRGLPAVLRGERDITDLLASEEQRGRIAALTAVMSLLEGHADVVMDEVGPEVIPSVATIRERFTQRRKGAGTVDVLLRRLLGLEAKMRQYRDGAAFVRAVTEQVGTDGFNRVWTSPETLPRATEITDPAAWVQRVHG